MPPQVHDRWPSVVRNAFAEMNRRLELGDEAGVVAGCGAVIGLLRDMETPQLDAKSRRQVAYAYFDLTSYFEQLGDDQKAKWAYEQSRDRWSALPPDFETLTQSAGCRNHLGLIALEAGDFPAAEAEFESAMEARREAGRLHPKDPDQGSNIVYFAGAACNLGGLHQQRGDRTAAAARYDQAIQMLEGMLAEAGDPADGDFQGMIGNMWGSIYGTPHWIPVAQRFLETARAGRDSLSTEDRS